MTTPLRPREFSELYGVDEKTLEQYVALGMPHHRISENEIVLQMPNALRWLRRVEGELARGKAVGLGLPRPGEDA